MFCKNGVLRNFAKFIRKHLCQRLFFNKITGTGSDSCFPVNFANFLRAPPVAASELVKKCCFKLFRILQIEYIIYKKNALQTLWTYPLFLQRWYFWLRLNMVHPHRVSTQTSYLSGFFHITFVDGWQEQVVPLDVHVIDKALSV